MCLDNGTIDIVEIFGVDIMDMSEQWDNISYTCVDCGTRHHGHVRTIEPDMVM